LIWGTVGLLASIISGVTLILGRPSLYEVNWITAGVLIWIGGLIFFGIGALLDDREKTRVVVNR
jgi:hypothetical protein